RCHVPPQRHARQRGARLSAVDLDVVGVRLGARRHLDRTVAVHAAADGIRGGPVAVGRLGRGGRRSDVSESVGNHTKITGKYRRCLGDTTSGPSTWAPALCPSRSFVSVRPVSSPAPSLTSLGRRFFVVPAYHDHVLRVPEVVVDLVDRGFRLRSRGFPPHVTRCGGPRRR